MELLTSSRLRSYRACARQHFFAHVQGFRSIADAPALAFGTALHTALEAWWRAPREGAHAAALATLPMTMDPFARARAEAMLAGYDAYWAGSGYVALEVEREFRMPLLNPETGAASRTWLLAGKMDGIIVGPDGRKWVLEHKSTSENVSPGSQYRQRLALDGQVSQYIEAAHSIGYDVAGVIYDVLVKPRHTPAYATPEAERKYTKPTKADPTPRLYADQRDRDETVAEYRERVAAALLEAPHKYFAAVEVVRLENERDDFQWDVWQLATLMRESARTGRAPRNPDACVRYGSPCPYWPVCSGEASLDDPTRYVRVGANPELSNTTNTTVAQEMSL